MSRDPIHTQQAVALSLASLHLQEFRERRAKSVTTHIPHKDGTVFRQVKIWWSLEIESYLVQYRV